MSNDTNSICRLCLEEGGSTSVFLSSQSYPVSWSQMLVTIASVTASEGDGLPPLGCAPCLRKLETSYEFKRQCERSHSILVERQTIVKKELPDDAPPPALSASDALEIEYKVEPQDPLFYDFGADDGQSESEASAKHRPESIVEKKGHRRRRRRKSIDGSEHPTKRPKLKGDRGAEGGRKNCAQVAKERLQRAIEVFGFDVRTLKRADGRYHCDKCPKTFADRRNVIRHLESHLGIKSFFCQLCQKNFARGSDHMQTHLRAVSEKRYQCDQCGKKFSTKRTLTRHLPMHKDERPFVCDDCGKGFKSKLVLIFHTKIHAKTKEYVCQFCSQEFTLRKGLLSHISYKHNTSRNYECETCKKKFGTSKALNSHNRRHLGIKNYKCKHCDMAFVCSSNLIAHTKSHTHEKPHPCRVCSVSFGRTDHRNRHERTAHGVNFRLGKGVGGGLPLMQKIDEKVALKVN